MKKKDNKIINEIQKIRARNNKNWMDILRVAMKYAPISTKKIIKKINLDDKKISKLVQMLASRN